MSAFDEQPDGDPHGECAAEIERLRWSAWLLAWQAIGHTAAGVFAVDVALNTPRRPVCAHCQAEHDVESGAMAAHVRACPSNPMVAELSQLRAVAADLPPLAIAEVVRVLRHGAVKYAAASPATTGSGQTIGDHLRHALEHIGASITASDPHGCVDAETNALHITHATARLLLAAEMALATEVGRG